MSVYADRIKRAAAIAMQYGMTDGAHHKQWCIDQMLQAMLGDAGYAAFIEEANDDPDYEEWNAGVSP